MYVSLVVYASLFRMTEFHITFAHAVLYSSHTFSHILLFLHLGYEAEDEVSLVIKEEVSEEVLSHKSITGIRKLVLLPLQTILVTVFLYLLLLPLHVYVGTLILYTVRSACM